MKIILILGSYFISISELLLAGYFWKTNSGNAIRKIMAVLLLTTGLWVGATAASTYRAPGTLADLLATMVYVISTFSLTLLLHFILLWPLPMRWLNQIRAVFLYIPAVFFGILLLFTRTIINNNIFSSNYYGHSEPGPLFIIYNLYLLMLFVSVLVIAFRRAYPRETTLSSHARILFWSILLGGLPTAILDLVVAPLFNINPNPLIGVIPNAIWAGAIVYIVSRR